MNFGVKNQRGPPSRASYVSMRLIKSCLVCGKEFSCRPRPKTPGKYCSNACKHRGRQKTGFKLCLPSGCIEWLGTSHSGGYRCFRITDGPQVKAHRWFWEQLNGPIPIDKEVHHRCENKACVNPDHLELLTREDHNALHHQGRHYA